MEVQNCLSIIRPTLVLNRTDKWVWKESPTGCYNVRDMYTWLCRTGAEAKETNSWNWLWKIKVPERVKFFMWIILHKSLQVNANRFKCKMATSPACPRCSAPVEDELHFLRDCPHAREIWLRMGALSWRNFLSDTVEQWIKNQACGNHGNLMSPETITQGNDFISQVWKPPPPGKLKLNTDESWKRGSDHVGGGSLLRGSDGVWIQGFLSCSLGENAFIVEVGALRDGLRMTWAHGCRDIIAEIDSKDVLGELKNESNHLFCPILAEIATLLRQQWQVTLQWTPREGNTAADCLAHLGATASSLGVHVLERPPVEVESFILRDSFSCL